MITLKIKIPSHPELDSDYWRGQLRNHIGDIAGSYIDDNQELIKFEEGIEVEVKC